MPDPLNPMSERDLVSGLTYSLYQIKDKPEPEIRNPAQLDGSIYRFSYRGTTHQSIYLVGDFNDWSPYRHRLEEDPHRPGFFTISLRIGPGRHFYHFLVDGFPVADPLNNDQMLDKTGQQVAFFDVPS
jgi:1,4-alpha-glucan branching enzyme